MGRVGSGSINQALYDKGINALHAHWLSGDFPEAEFPTTKLKVIKWIQEDKFDFLNIITPIREPMARNLSAFTFSLIKYGASGRQETIEELQNLFLTKYNYAFPDLWFYNELIKNFKFNPFKKRFNHKKGYSIYKYKQYKFLILRLEDAPKILPEALRKFLKIRKIEMPHKSILETKKYIGEKYRALKTLKYPEEYLEKVYNLQYVKHFYTENEIEKFKERWSRYEI